VVTIPVKRNIVRAYELRLAIVKASGYELCRAAVREGLLGKLLADKPFSLRDRLNAAKASFLQYGDDSSISKTHTEFKFAPEIDRVLNYISYPKDACVILGRRLHKEIGTSVSRRAILPLLVSSELINAAQVADEPVILISREGKQPMRVIYAPELICRPLQGMQASSTQENEPVSAQVKKSESGNQSYFDTIFTTTIDPWNYTSPYEQVKYEQTLAMLPTTRIERALELACAEGHFTVQLAPRVDRLVAADISQVALDRAAKRCAGMKNVCFQRIDLVKEPLPCRFDLIVCSEVLYYVGGHKDLEITARKLAKALVQGGYLLTAHAHEVVDDPDHTGFDWNLQFGAKVIGETLERTRLLRLVKELRTPLYRIQLFQRISRIHMLFCSQPPEVAELKHQPTQLLPEVAACVRWRSGGHHRSSAQQNVVTDRLPILMYHRVAPTGLASTARYRLTSETFEEQLRYLHDAGYYSINLEDWLFAMERKMPLPGKAVVLTFDDGYLDFKTYAWPLLRQYGFLATVFLVTDNVGKSNSWDSVYGEEIPLLGWDDIRQLQGEGVEFGSHTASHPYLTALSAEGIVREGARSRAILGRKLGKMVKAFAYPYGDVDQVVQHLIGACGYTIGLTYHGELSSYHDPLLALPRLAVFGTDSLQDFIAKLGIQQTHEYRLGK
jgi:peptidoglycan/xylan/chitin deacetylase (PgdA/CDA1 family)/2-polyprenyl-3-methyl-5-hydroxy-6-metoxy-1,4-benzoquinol methylase